MNTFKKILWAFVDLITFAVGSAVLVTNALTGRNEVEAGYGAFMIVFGLLIRNWRKDLFANHSKKNGLEFHG